MDSLESSTPDSQIPQPESPQLDLHWDKLMLEKNDQTTFVDIFLNFKLQKYPDTPSDVKKYLQRVFSVKRFCKESVISNYEIYIMVKKFLENYNLPIPNSYKGSCVLIVRLLKAIFGEKVSDEEIEDCLATFV